jgi:cobalt-zinc-cadmium efflux system protein
VVLVANLGLVGALLGVGITAHSLGVWAEGVDYLADAAAIGVSLFAINLAGRPPTPSRPAGYPRATRYAAAVNAGWLLALSLLVAGGAIDRLAVGARQVRGLPVLVVSGIAAAVMAGGAFLLGGDVDDSPTGDDGDDDDDVGDLNVKAVLLDTAADAAAAAGVAVTGGIIYVTGGDYWLDPAVALLIAVVVGYHAARLLARIVASLRR